MHAKLIRESISVPDINEIPEEDRWEYCAKLISLLPKTNKRLRARFIAYVFFELGGGVKYRLSQVKTNYLPKKGEKLLVEHVFGKQKAGELISKYVDKYGDITPDKLRQLIDIFGKYIMIPRTDVNGKSINKSIDYLQNQENLITYDEYVNKLNEFIVNTSKGNKPLEIIEGQEELINYFKTANDFIKKYIK